MMMRILFFSAFLMIFLNVTGQDKPAYRIFNSKGRSADYKDIVKAAQKADLIFFGELHSDPICHWLEFELTKDLYEIKKENLVLAAEMFERDNQLILNEYINKTIRKKDFEAEAKLWKNYKTDYAPILDFAREKGIEFRATNVPRRYAALVNIKGFEGLDSINAFQRGLMAPLPIKFDPELKSYKEMASMSGDGMPAHTTANLAKAQALKDATMAYFILKTGHEGQTVLHFNGSYHSENNEGIVWYIQQEMKRRESPIRIVTIATVDQDSINELMEENIGKADFIICVPSSMTKTE